MKKLSYTQVAFLLGKSENMAMAMILKANNQEVPFSMMNPDDLVAYRKNFDMRMSVEDLTAATGVNCEALINDINTNFLKNAACLSYLMKKLKEKTKPNKLGFAKQKVTVPEEVTSLMTNNTRLKLVTWLQNNFSDTIEYIITN